MLLHGFHEWFIRLDSPVLIEVAYSPSSEGARAGLFLVIVGGSHEISSMPAVGIKRGSKDHSIHYIKGDGLFVRRGGPDGRHPPGLDSFA